MSEFLKKHKITVVGVYTFAICVVMAISAYHLLPGSMRSMARNGLIIFSAGVLMMGPLLWIWRSGESADFAAESSGDTVRTAPGIRWRGIRWRMVMSGVVAMALLTQMNLLNRSLLTDPFWVMLSEVSHHVQVVLFVLGVSLTTWGLSGAHLKLSQISLPRLQRHHLLLVVIQYHDLAAVAAVHPLGQVVHPVRDARTGDVFGTS